ncbi:MAG: MBOAT family protein [Bryobacterales bacterium]|nr:MBOAT family protein [Bryobacterales bacterium]
MSFDSPSFWWFVIAVWCACQLIRHNAARKMLLLAASYLVYSSFFPAGSKLIYALLLAGVTAGSFAAGRTANRGLLIAGVWIAAGGLAAAKGWLSPLPVGLSFYLLQAIAWMMESYRSAKPGGENFLDFALYMSFFPRLTAGPIVRAEEFLPQLAKRTLVESAALWEGVVLIVFGLFKKLALADNLGLAVDPVFADLHLHHGASPSRILLATYGFAAQIYCDFSGYSDMALGTARLFGYRLPENFNWPYLARNPADFWRRWHISLSNWLRDYVYFSLPGHRAKSRVPMYLNLLATMAICGLWHGYRWTYLLWGIYHGFLLVLHHTSKRLNSVLLMQQLAVAGWILFRAERVSDLAAYSASLMSGPFFTGFGEAEWLALVILGAVVLFHAIQARVPVTKAMLTHRWNPWTCTALLVLALVTAALSVPQQQMFLYFWF